MIFFHIEATVCPDPDYEEKIGCARCTPRCPCAPLPLVSAIGDAKTIDASNRSAVRGGASRAHGQRDVRTQFSF
jgi:hypothetical protein